MSEHAVAARILTAQTACALGGCQGHEMQDTPHPCPQQTRVRFGEHQLVGSVRIGTSSSHHEARIRAKPRASVDAGEQREVVAHVREHRHRRDARAASDVRKRLDCLRARRRAGEELHCNVARGSVAFEARRDGCGSTRSSRWYEHRGTADRDEQRQRCESRRPPSPRDPCPKNKPAHRADSTRGRLDVTRAPSPVRTGCSHE
jgi:hypothetical protein